MAVHCPAQILTCISVDKRGRPRTEPALLRMTLGNLVWVALTLVSLSGMRERSIFLQTISAMTQSLEAWLILVILQELTQSRFQRTSITTSPGMRMKIQFLAITLRRRLVLGKV